MKRRSFLSAMASLLALEASGLLVASRSVLADPAPRKLALLIGIDDYPQAALSGCLTDVALQQNLLMHRYGFLPADILTLTNQAATAAAVTQLFANQLQQLRPSDLVVIHFSGQGGIALNQQPMLIMADGSTIAWEALERLLQTCPTQRMITVLDTCYRSQGHRRQGNLRLRSALQDLDQPVHPAPVQPLPGILLAAAPINQLAFEADYADFSAGQFTYALTQALWQAHPDRQKIATMLTNSVLPATIGAITNVDAGSNTGEVWLGGMPSAQLETLNAQSVLRSGQGQSLQILSRQGLKAKIRAADLIQPDWVAQEQIRVIPRSVPLAIAIAPTVPKIARVDAIAALASLPNVTTKLVGEGKADYLLAKMPQPNTVVASLPDAVVTDVLPSARYGLFSHDQQPIANAAGLSGEAIKSMVKRLSPIVQSLQAAKLLTLLDNQTSSGLSVGMTVELLTPPSRLLLRQATRSVPGQNVAATPIPIDSAVRYQLLGESQPYWLLVGWDSLHNMDIVVPSATTTFESRTFESIVREPGGEMMVYLIASDRPFTQTLTQLAIATSQTTTGRMLPQPAETMQALVQDLAIDAVDGNYRFDVDRYAVIPLQFQLV
jgi:Caspase domain